MLKKDVLDHYKTPAILAEALDISEQAISQWGDKVPPFRAAQIHKLTRGKLKFDPSDYPDYWKRRGSL